MANEYIQDKEIIMSKRITKEMLQRFPDENLELAASITLTLFNQSSFFSRTKRALGHDLKLFVTELERRQE